MGLFAWHEKLARGISGRNLSLAIVGKFIGLVMLGSLFSLELVTIGYFLLLVGVALLFVYFYNAYPSYVAKKRMTYESQLWGVSSLFLLGLYLGIQSPHIPFQWYIFGASVIMVLPAGFDTVRALQ